MGRKLPLAFLLTVALAAFATYLVRRSIHVWSHYAHDSTAATAIDAIHTDACRCDDPSVIAPPYQKD